MTSMNDTSEQVNEEVDVLNQALERMQQEMNDQWVPKETLIAVQSRGGIEPRNEQPKMPDGQSDTTIFHKVCNGHISGFRAQEFIESSLVSRKVLFIIRLSFLVITTALYIAFNVARAFYDLTSFKFVTNLSWIGAIIYFAFATMSFVRGEKAVNGDWRLVKWAHW
jgi:hypothetical protein